MPLTSKLTQPLTRKLTDRGSGFSPASIGLLGAWYDPSDMSSLYQDSAGTTPVTASGQLVGMMKDKSGNGNHATQATAGNRMTVDATKYLVGGAAKTIASPAFLDSTYNNAFSIFVVTRSGVPHTDNRIVFGTSSPTTYIGINGSNLQFDFASSMVGDGGGANMASNGILEMTVGSGSLSCGIDRLWYQNSNGPRSGSASKRVKTTGVSGSLAFLGNALTLGGLTSSSFLWPGSVAEVLVYKKQVSDAEHKRIMVYLTNKWGLYAKPLIVCCGNSLTSGTGSTGLATQDTLTTGTNYPSRLLNSLSATYDVRTDAYPGRVLSQMLTESPLFCDAMTVSGSNRKVAIVWEITNTLAANQSVATTLASLIQYCNERRAAGFNVLVGTCLNRQDAGTYAGFNTDRQTINASILANFASYADGVIDFAAVTELTDPTNTTYFAADKVHLTDTGYQKASDTIVAKFTALGW